MLRATLRPGGGRTTGSTDDAKHVFVLHDWPLNPTVGECVHSTACLGVAARCGACSTATFSERDLDCRNLLLPLAVVLPPSRVGAGSALCSLLYILNESHVFYAARSQGETCAHYIAHTADGKNWQGSSKGGQGPGKGRHTGKLGPTT